jgi:hypothetical protein
MTRNLQTTDVERRLSETRQRVREAGLPEKHAMRLAEGW